MSQPAKLSAKQADRQLAPGYSVLYRIQYCLSQDVNPEGWTGRFRLYMPLVKQQLEARRIRSRFPAQVCFTILQNVFLPKTHQDEYSTLLSWKIQRSPLEEAQCNKLLFLKSSMVLKQRFSKIAGSVLTGEPRDATIGRSSIREFHWNTSEFFSQRTLIKFFSAQAF